MENITIPNGVINIENYVFAGCNSLQSINVSEGNSNYLSCGGVLFDKSKSVLIKYPEGEKDTSYIIPDGVTSIGDFAFMYCISLKSITIPNSVTSIGKGALFLCESLKSITIPDSVTSIEEDAFSQCKSLKSITIPNSVTSIGDGAFMYCESLQSITIPENVTSDEVTVTVKVNPIAMKMWALKYSRHIKVIFPQSLVDEIKADIDFAKKNYE